MKKIFLGLFVLVSALSLTACGTTLVEAPPEVAELEVQVLTSISDSSSYKLEIRDSEGRTVFVDENLINRINVFTLELGEEYTVATQVEVANSLDKSSNKILFERKVNMVAPQQRVALDLNSLLEFEIKDFYDGVQIVARFPVGPDNLELLVGAFESSGFASFDRVAFPAILGWGIMSETAMGEGGQDTIYLRLDPSRDPESLKPIVPPASRMVFLHFNKEYFLPLCGSMAGVRLGEATFVWESELSRKTETVHVWEVCRG